jgi:glycosyltransferase involved in cell wall biosynthesis
VLPPATRGERNRRARANASLKRGGSVKVLRMKILFVSQMWPGPDDPDHGTFLVPLVEALRGRGHDLELAVLTTRAGGRTKYLKLLREARAAARRTRPDVVYAHYLVPTGLVADLASRAPFVVTAHGRDVRNVGSVRGVRTLTEAVVRRAHTVVAVSHYLRRELEARVPSARGKVKVVDSGVDLERFRGGDQAEARAALGWNGDGPAYLFVGSLDERKNVVRLAEAFAHLETGRLAFVGDGPLRAALEGRPRVTLAGRVPHEDVRRWIQAADVVCQPSLVEPFGQALLEAMASERSVVATAVGGPPEFVIPAAGVLVDPGDVDGIAEGLRKAAELPSPNRAARAAAAAHDVNFQAARIEEILEQAARGRRA